MTPPRPLLPADILVDELAPLAAALLPPEVLHPAARPLADVLTPAGLSTATGRLARALGCDDTPAVVSYWTLTYFGRVVPPLVAVALAAPGPVGVTVAADRAAVVLGDDGALAGLRLGHAEGMEQPGAVLLQRLVRTHLEPVVAAVGRWSGLAPRLLWTNAAHYFEWMLRRLLASPAMPPVVAAEAEAFLTDRHLPDGGSNPLFGRIVYRPAPAGPVRRRKVCCLRHRLPGTDDCATLCPLPEVNASA